MQYQKFLSKKPKVKVKPKKTFNKKVKIKEKELDYATFLDEIKKSETDYFPLLDKFLKSISVEKRIQSFIVYLEKSSYAAFKTGVKSFKRAIEKYNNTKDIKDLNNYIENLNTPTDDIAYNSFNYARREVLQDLKDDDYHNTREAFSELLDANNTLYPLDDYINACKQLLIDIAPIKWPEAKNLKILFGEQNERI